LNRPFSIQQALEVFLRGFSITRSFTRPYQSSRIGSSIWLLADVPGGSSPERTPEVVAYDADPETVRETLKGQPLARHFLCVLLDDPTKVQETCVAYKRLGYRLLGREPLFVLDTARRAPFEGRPIRRVIESAEANAVAKAARYRQILPEHLIQDDAICRLYASFEEETPVGWVRSIRTHPDCSWVSNLFVHPSHRRKGIGRALMSRMLDDDARYGVQWSVLLASLTGAKLYPHLGYAEYGLLLLFSPLKSREPLPA
jgi:hypothetical protein